MAIDERLLSREMLQIMPNKKKNETDREEIERLEKENEHSKKLRAVVQARKNQQ